jgi:hypothetical protein
MPERAFVTRGHSSKLISAVVKTARTVGMLASVLGLALRTALLYFDTRSWDTAAGSSRQTVRS